jgi:hypothetical protein
MNTTRAGQPSCPQSPRKLPNSTWAEIRTAHASGIGLREIARSMGIPAGTVLARSKREGWTRQIQTAKALALPPETQTTSPRIAVADAVATTMAERGRRHVERVAGIVERTLPAVEAMAPAAILDRVEDLDRLDKVARRTYGLREGDGQPSVLISIAMLGVRPQEACVEGRVIDAES